MIDVLQFLILVLVIIGSILYGIHKSKKEKDPWYICVIRIAVYVSLTFSPIFLTLEFVHSNAPVIELKAKIIGNKDEGIIELELSNNSKSFGTDIKFKYALALYEEDETSFKIKRAVSPLQNNQIFLPPEAKDSTYIIETDRCEAMKNIFNIMDTLENHQLSLYIFMDYSYPVVPFLRIKRRDVLLYKNNLSKFYTVADADKYVGEKKDKTEKIFSFLEKDVTKQDFGAFFENINK